MEKLYDSGKCKAIGVSNFTTTKLQWLIDEASVVPHINQVELHPYLPQNKLVYFCRNNRIQVVAYATLGSPGSRNTIASKPDSPLLLQDPVVVEIASRNNITPAQVLIAWSLQQEIPVVVKASSRNRIVENLDSQNITLNDGDMKILSNMNTRHRFIDFKVLLTDNKTLEDYEDGGLFD